MATGPLQIVALGPVSVASLLWSMNGAPRATVVIKVAFALADGGVLQPCAPVPIVQADVAASDGASIVVANEIAPYLPNAGVIVTGSARAPWGLPTPAMAARFTLLGAGTPRLTKMVHVFGDRASAAQTPVPFEAMPLTWERAYGGPGFRDNPAGRGAQASGPLPNVVDPVDARRPAGFGPVSASWPARHERLQSASLPVMNGSTLELSDDLDWRWFQAAPMDQQTDYLRGDEQLVLEGFSADPGAMRVQLPSARGVVRYEFAGASRRQAIIDLVADTLHVDVDRRVVSILWRGHLALESFAAAARMRVLAGVELPGMPVPWTVGRDVITAREQALPRLSEPDPSDLATLTNPAGEAAPASSSLGRAKLPAIVDVDADLESTHALLEDEYVVDDADSVSRTHVEDPERAARVGRSVVLKRLDERSALDGLSAPGADLSGLDLSGQSLVGARLAGASFEGAKLDGANLEGADLARAAFAGASLAGANLRRAALDGASLQGANLRGADLTGASLRRAGLDGAHLCDAELAGADFSDARGHRADFRDASLDAATLRGARFHDACFAGANLNGAHAEGVDVSRSNFTGADLRGSTFTDAIVTSTNATLARLDGANFQRADLTGTTLRGAVRDRADFTDAKVTPASDERDDRDAGPPDEDA